MTEATLETTSNGNVITYNIPQPNSSIISANAEKIEGSPWRELLPFSAPNLRGAAYAGAASAWFLLCAGLGAGAMEIAMLAGGLK